MNAEFFYLIEKVRHGPVSFEALRKLAEEGAIRRDHRVWTKGMSQWEPASSVADLFTDLPPDQPDEDAPPLLPSHEGSTPPPLEPGFANSPPQPPNWMGLWSFILPGTGQVICGQTVKGALMIVTSIGLNLFSGGLLSIITCPVGSFDAILIAKKRNAGGQIKPWEFFPDPAALTPKQVVIVTGIVAGLLVVNIAAAVSERGKLQDEWHQSIGDNRY